MEPVRKGHQRASETIRKQKRKELDARRGKCRIRIGSHLEQWCRLKEQLGFSLHSQLAKYLLERYNSLSSVVKTGQDGSNTTPHPFPSDALQHLVVLSHNHSQECGFIPNMKPTTPDPKGIPEGMLWECLAGHTFSWNPPSPQSCTAPPCKAASGGDRDKEKEEKAVTSRLSPPPSPAVRRRRSLRRAAAAHAFSLALASDSPCPVDAAEPSSREDGEGSADREKTACMSPSSNGEGLGKEAELLSGRSVEETAIPSEEIIPGITESPGPENTSIPLEVMPDSLPDQPEEPRQGGEEDEEGDEDDLAEEDNLAYADDLRDENYYPSLQRDSKLQRHHKGDKSPSKEEQQPPPGETCLTSLSEEESGEVGFKKRIQPNDEEEAQIGSKRISFKKRKQPNDEDVAQIGSKRIRKAAKREILLCDYDGCGKIFSNRQYLNHHKKYQHVNQKTFTCSAPTCGKSFNFKKHLKEHEKLHSDKRDYICEFCARSFRTSSNLIIHRRIHTGEKPLQCEICGFTCRQKASLNWHMKKHDADSFYQFSCDLCGKKFEKKDNVAAHKSKSHPEAVTGPPQSVTDQPLATEQLENSGRVQPRDMLERTEHSPLAITVIIE